MSWTFYKSDGQALGSPGVGWTFYKACGSTLAQAAAAATATLATNVTVSANDSTCETVYPVFVDGATGTQGIETDAGLTYNPSTGVLTATQFTGAVSGTITGAASCVTVSANNSTSETVYPVFVDGVTGSQGIESDCGLTYNPSSGVLTATQFTGNVNGNLTGTLQTAAQANVTSLGTLTALTVDDVAVNGKVITMTGDSCDTVVMTAAANGAFSLVTTDTAAAAGNIVITADGTVDINSAGLLTLDSGAAINIEPAACSAILLDGTISIDAGVVTGATSITSTAFVGTLSTASQGNITTVGALCGGSIGTSFGTINNGASTITTTGLISGGSLDIDNVLINGTTIGHTCDTDLLTLGNATLLAKGTVTVGVDDTGHDVKFFGAAAGAFALWDEDLNLLELRGATAAGPGHLKLTTGEATVVANDVLGKIEFQAPAECGTDAVKVSATIAAVAQGTFAANVNATDLILYTAHDCGVAERFRFTSQGEIGIAGANYGSDGQVLTSTGAGTAVAWEAAGGISGLGSTDNVVLRANGTGGATAQGSSVVVTDAGAISPAFGTACLPGLSFGTDTDTGVYRSGTNIMSFATSGVERMRIIATGAVEIETATTCLANLTLLQKSNGTTGAQLFFTHCTSSSCNSDENYIFTIISDNGGTRRLTNYIGFGWVSNCASSMESEIRFGTMNNACANYNTTAILSYAGVWTDSSGEKHKDYEGDPLCIYGGIPGQVITDKIKELSGSRYHAKNHPDWKPILERHISPTAEQFYDLFGTGRDPRLPQVCSSQNTNEPRPGLAPKDMAGVALLGLQELIARVERLEGNNGD